MEHGIIFIPNLPKQRKLPRKKKKAFIKKFGPMCYRMMLAGSRFLTSDYPIINGVLYSPYNKKVTRKVKMPSVYSKKTIDSSRYTTIKLENNKI